MTPKPNITITDLVAGLLDNMTVTDEDIMSLRQLLRDRLTALDKMYIENARLEDEREEELALQFDKEQEDQKAFEEMLNEQQYLNDEAWSQRTICKKDLAAYIEDSCNKVWNKDKKSLLENLKYLVEYDIDTDTVTYEQLDAMKTVFSDADLLEFYQLFRYSSIPAVAYYSPVDTDDQEYTPAVQ